MPAPRAHDLGDRQERQALARRLAVAGHDGRRLAERAGELADEPRLADARRADERDDAGLRRGGRRVERGVQPRELARAADQRRLQAALRAALALGAVDEAERRAPAAPCPSARAARRARGARRRARGGRSRRRRSTSPGAAACSSRAATLTVSPTSRSADFAGSTTTSPVLTPVRRATVAPQRRSRSSLSAAERLAHPLGRPHGAQRVVLGDGRDAPDRHHRVADELRDRPALGLDRAAHLGVEAVHDPAQRLGVEPVAERGEPDHVGEEHGERLADLAARRPVPGRRRRDRRAAGQAEPRPRLGSPPRTRGTAPSSMATPKVLMSRSRSPTTLPAGCRRSRSRA